MLIVWGDDRPTGQEPACRPCLADRPISRPRHQHLSRLGDAVVALEILG